MIRKTIETVAGKPQVSSGIRVAGGSASQEQLANGEFYPDRTLYPLILQPFCSYHDGTTGKTVENAMPEVADGNWYRLCNANRNLGICEATKIASGTQGTDANGQSITVFDIVTAIGSENYGRLTVKENVQPDDDVTYIFIGTLTADGRELRLYYNSTTKTLSEVPDILFDNNDKGVYDPLRGTQYFTINPSLSTGGTATWIWMSYHELEGGWVELGTTQLDWAVEKIGNGIRIDRKKMQDMILLRCVAETEVDGETVQLERPVTHTRIMPPFEAELIRVGAVTTDVSTICPYALIRAGNLIVTDDNELSVRWLNDSGAVVGKGINPTIRLSSLGSTRGLRLEVKDRGGWAALMQGDFLILSGTALVLVRSKIND